MTSARFFSILEDKKGNFWLGSIGSGVYYYDGKSFQNYTTRDGLAGNSVNAIYEDRTGNIWVGASRYDGNSFRNFTAKDGLTNSNVNSIIEDKNGNIWTCSESAESPAWVGIQTGNIQAWAISRYDGNSLSSQRPTVTEIANRGMIFGFLIAFDGSIWFGDFNGVHRYDGKTITDFKDKQVQK